MIPCLPHAEFTVLEKNCKERGTGKDARQSMAGAESHQRSLNLIKNRGSSRWRQRTLAIAAGLTDHARTVRALLFFRDPVNIDGFTGIIGLWDICTDDLFNLRLFVGNILSKLLGGIFCLSNISERSSMDTYKPATIQDVRISWGIALEFFARNAPLSKGA